MLRSRRFATLLGAAAFALALCALGVTLAGFAFHTGAGAQVAGEVPGQSLGISSDSEFWRRIRQGEEFNASVADPLGRVLVQSEGDNWRAFRNGPLSIWGGWALGATLAVLLLFYLLRGRVRIDSGRSGETIERFNNLERFSHWLLAGSFIILGLTGLNILYGRYVLKPAIGPDAFALVTRVGKWLHNYVALAFMVALVLIFVLWVRHNLPKTADFKWILRGGGLLVKGSHPPAHKFNAGQKLVFWAVILLGASLSISGIALLFPFQTAMFAKTFAIMNMAGFDLPMQLTPLEEAQLAQLWHSVVALALIAVVLAHIYIGSLGMEGAFDAMGTGQVDKNWAREHHSLWVDRIESGGAGSSAD